MNYKKKIYRELKSFKRRYWAARLIQGVLIFAGTGLVLFGLLALIEYAVWLSSAQRTILFYTCMAVEVVLLGYYIFWPLTQLVGIGNALSDGMAARMIGKRLNSIDDKLLNFLQLDRSAARNELIDAGLEQKSKSLIVYRFHKLYDYGVLKPYLLFLIPLLALLLFVGLGDRWHMLETGTSRLINYNVEFERTLPFELIQLNDLQVDEGGDLLVEFSLKGEVIPDQLQLKSDQVVAVVSVENNRLSYLFKNCYQDISFRMEYDGIYSKPYTISVQKLPVMGRVSIVVHPPLYTGIDKFIIQNTNKIEVPEGSSLAVTYAFKNTRNLNVEVSVKENALELFTVESGETIERKIESSATLFKAYEDDLILHALTAEVITDKRPYLSVEIDSVDENIVFRINANDDYKIRQASALIEGLDGSREKINLNAKEKILKRELRFSYDEVALIKAIEIDVWDDRHKSSRRLELARFSAREKTTQELLQSAGQEIALLRDKEYSEKQNSSPKKNTQNNNKNKQQREAKELDNIVRELSKNDSIQFDRLEKINEDIQQLLEKMNKEIPDAQKRITEQKLEVKLQELEKEWMILKVVDELSNLQDSLQKNPFVDGKQADRLMQDAEKLEEMMQNAEKENVEWQKFEELEKNNKQLKENSDDREESEEQRASEENKEDQNEERNEQKEPNSDDELKKQMQEDSEQLKEQLSAMSAMMMMESMQKNIELIRRLELRSLKASKKQEEIYVETADRQEYDKQIVLAQTEIRNSASSILDSLGALTISDPMLGNVLNKNRQLLEEHVREMMNLGEMDMNQLSSNQRYLQYSLNDLASILYDILKSENERMQSMMAGKKVCNKPKSGNGKKESLAQQQKKLGEKMGKRKSQGKDKNGRQTMSNAELLELIKEQERILGQYEKQQKNKGGQKAGDQEVIDKMNKQLSDLINNNINKAIERNKEIEDKLIAIEKSDNQKREEDKKRQSQENKLNYDAIRNAALQNYLRTSQAGKGIEDLPGLKTYYSGKWVIINQ
jgi:hypothetical protein